MLVDQYQRLIIGTGDRRRLSIGYLDIVLPARGVVEAKSIVAGQEPLLDGDVPVLEASVML